MSKSAGSLFRMSFAISVTISSADLPPPPPPSPLCVISTVVSSRSTSPRSFVMSAFSCMPKTSGCGICGHARMYSRASTDSAAAPVGTRYLPEAVSA